MGKDANLSDYIEAMKKDSFTENWDVVVTYDQKEINDLLAQRFMEPDHGMTTNVKLSMSTEDRNGTYTQWYEFDLGPPLIQFQSASESPTCSLQTKITKGKYWSVDEEGTHPATDLSPNAYTISLNNVDLGSVTGNSNFQPANDVVVFPDSDTKDYHVVIDMHSSKQLNVTVDHPTIPDPPFPMKNVQLSTALKEHFTLNISAIDYTLAIVNNTKPPAGALDLVPRAFLFTTMKISDTQSYLSILIQTRASSKRGNTDKLQSRWNSHWSNAGVNPVPKGQSASIIINNSFFVSAFVEPALKAHKATITTEKMGDEGGIRVKGNWPKLTREGISKFSDEGAKFQTTFQNVSISTKEYDPNSGGDPLKITFSQSNGTDKPATIGLSWSYSFNNDWNGMEWWKEPSPGEHSTGFITRYQKVNGTFKTTYSVNASRDLTALTDESLTVDFGLKKEEWTVDWDPEEGGSFWDSLLSFMTGTSFKKSEIPDWVKNTAINKIDFNFDFGTLRFFSLTNILLPGRKVIDVDIKDGLRVPRDVVIVGNVVKSLELAK